MASTPGQITALLKESREGNDAALNALYPLVYDELQQIAHYRLLKYRPGDTLNTTALVHEAFLKLFDESGLPAKDRLHFFALASHAMRFIMVDYARSRAAGKRGGDGVDVPLSQVQIGVESKVHEMLSLNQALETLTLHNERLGKLVEYKFFGGLTHEEIADVTGFSVPTIKRDWRRARTWLYRLMQE